MITHENNMCFVVGYRSCVLSLGTFMVNVLEQGSVDQLQSVALPHELSHTFKFKGPI